MVSVTLRTTTGLPGLEPVGAVRVRVFDASGEAFVTEGDTDSDGEVVLLLDDTTSYWVRFFKSGWKWPTKARIFVDETTGGTSFDARGTDLVASPPSTDPLLCSVGGIIANPAGVPVAGVVVRFVATELPRVLDRRAIIPTRVEARSQVFGIFEVELIKNGEYEVYSEGFGGVSFDDFSSLVRIPDTDFVLLSDLLWPYLYRVDVDDAALALAVGATVELPIAAVLSSGLSTPFSLGTARKTFGVYVRVRSSDDSVVSFSMKLDGDDEYLVLTAGKAGTADITFELVEGSTSARLPEPTSILPTIAVTVS